jgi:hypothetical protein
MEEAGISQVMLVPFGHFEQTSMQIMWHTKFETHKNHQ